MGPGGGSGAGRSGPVRAVATSSGGWGARVLDAVLPVQCAGCGEWDTVLCARCAALAEEAEEEWQVLEGVHGLPPVGVWSLGEYSGPLRRIVLAAKHGERVGLDPFLVGAGVSLGRAIGASGLVGGTGRPSRDRSDAPREVWAVPAPSGWQRRHRGQLIVPAIAHGVAHGLNLQTGTPARVIDAVVLRPGSGSQSGRSSGQRRAGRSGSMRALVPVPPGVRVVVVDDVVTTGATVREVARVCGPGTVAVAALCRAGR